MSNDNPYVLEGFGEGFERGIRIVNDYQDRKFRKQQAERQAQMEDEKMGMAREQFGMEKQKFGLEQKKSEQDYELAKQKGAREEAMQPAEIASKKAKAASDYAEASLNNEKVHQQRRSDALDVASASEENLKKYGPDIADGLETPGYIDDAGELSEYILNGAKQPMTPELKAKGLGVINRTYAKDIKIGLNEKIGAQSRKENPNIPADAVIIDKRAIDFHPDDQGNTALELEVTARDSKGNTYYFKAPKTHRGSGEADDTIAFIPAQRAQEIAKGFYALRSDMKHAELKGIKPHVIASMIRQRAEGVTGKGAGKGNAPKDPAEVASIKAAGAAFFPDDTPAEQYRKATIRREQIMKSDKFNAAVQKEIDNGADETTARETVIARGMTQQTPTAVPKNLEGARTQTAPDGTKKITYADGTEEIVPPGGKPQATVINPRPGITPPEKVNKANEAVEEYANAARKRRAEDAYQRAFTEKK